MLLSFLNEVKIAGFGPLPVEQADEGDAEAGKKVRPYIGLKDLRNCCSGVVVQAFDSQSGDCRFDPAMVSYK